MTSRRETIGALLAALGGALAPSPAFGSGRPLYGQTLRLTLPIDVSRVDPHDASLGSLLLGASLFDGLYGRSGAGGSELVHPTLAAALPKRRGSMLEIELRGGLRSSRGSLLDAKAVAASLERSRERSSALARVQRVRASTPQKLELTTELDEKALALALTGLDCAIVPKGFDASFPDCTGALRSVGPGIKRLVRNGWAARGGSYLAGVELTSADLRTCLRDFETHKSELGFLGAGLHQGRSSARQFALGPIGWLVLLPGRGLGRFAAPGVLAESVSALRAVDFSALGVELGSSGTGASWAGPPCSILVESSEPWLVAVASELAQSWDAPRARVQVQAVPKPELEARRESGDFDCALIFLGTRAADEAHAALLRLSSLPPPKRPLGAMRLEDAIRHLPLALLGRPLPHGYSDPRLIDLAAPGALDLANARFSA